MKSGMSSALFRSLSARLTKTHRGTVVPLALALTTLALNLSVVREAKADWATTGSLNTPRQLHTATLLANGKVLVAGGNGSNTLSTAE
jgi:hypothetical protein